MVITMKRLIFALGLIAFSTPALALFYGDGDPDDLDLKKRTKVNCNSNGCSYSYERTYIDYYKFEDGTIIDLEKKTASYRFYIRSNGTVEFGHRTDQFVILVENCYVIVDLKDLPTILERVITIDRTSKEIIPGMKSDCKK